MNVRWASCCMHSIFFEQLGELPRQKFSCVITVDGAHNACGCVAAGIEESGEACQKLSRVSGGLVFMAKRVHGLEAGMVVYDDERVATSPVYGREKRSCEVDVDQPTRVRRCVEIARVRQA
eukprot:6200605-Pleurochrysis_carterae.AAC.2